MPLPAHCQQTVVEGLCPSSSKCNFGAVGRPKLDDCLKSLMRNFQERKRHVRLDTNSIILCIGFAYLVEGTVFVVGGEGILLEEVILEEASSLQRDFVILCQ